jgi:hypothetical protein
MKKLSKLLLFALLISFWACENEVDLTADWKDIPVVYALINNADTAHYIRVEKAFLDQNGSAFAAAQEVDSVYYDQITVTLTNLSTGAAADFVRVDGNLEGYPREDGVFATTPNYLYKLDGGAIDLEGENEMRLELNRGDELDPVTAEAVVLQEINPLTPKNPGDKVDFPTDRDVSFRWIAGDEAKVFDLTLLIHYFERPINNPDEVEDKTLEWRFAKGIRPTGNSSILEKIDGNSFYQFLGERIPVDPTLERGIVTLDLTITAGGEAIDQYLKIASANLGITSSQDIPIYTNMSEGRGIFSSIREITIVDLLISENTKINLIESNFTSGLNFVN